MKRLNLGCGIDIKEGYDNLDLIKGKGVDIVWNLNSFPYPIQSDTYDEVYARHVIEHLDDVIAVIKELYRILKPNGKLIIEVPYQTCIHSFGSIMHKRAFTLRSFDVFAKNTKSKLRNPEYGLGIEFKSLKRKLLWPKGWHIERFICEPLFNVFPVLYEHTFLRYLFPAFSVLVELEK